MLYQRETNLRFDFLYARTADRDHREDWSEDRWLVRSWLQLGAPFIAVSVSCILLSALFKLHVLAAYTLLTNIKASACVYLHNSKSP